MKQNPCIKCRYHCCIGDYGTFATIQDIKRIAEYTRKKPEDFAKYDDICSDKEEQEDLMKARSHSYFEYTEDGKILQLKSKKNGECIFLKDMRCTIYSVRPLICRIFPVGFRKRDGMVKILVEEEDRHCPVARKADIKDILRFLNLTDDKASALIKQFLREVGIYKKKIPILEKRQLNDVITHRSG